MQERAILLEEALLHGEYRRNDAEKCKMAVDKAMAKGPEYYSQMQKVYWVRMRERIFRKAMGHYSNGMFVCGCCTETERDFLTIDYVKRNGNKERLEVLGNQVPDGAFTSGSSSEAFLKDTPCFR
jgi:hypothetical protein